MPGGFGGGDMPEDFNPDNMPQGFSGDRDDGSADAAKEDAASADPQEKPAEKADSAGGQRPQPGGGSFPGMSGAPQQDNTAAYILLGVSALVLLLGLGFALKFKR